MNFIYRELRRSYWAKGVSRKLTETSFGNSSVVFGMYRPDGKQVGFAQVLTDAARFAYLMDVVVTETERGRGLGKWLNDCIVRHPELRRVRRWLLATRDAHALYRKSGWMPLKNPERFMMRSER